MRTTPDDVAPLEAELAALRADLDAAGCRCSRPWPVVRVHPDALVVQHGPACPLFQYDNRTGELN